MLGIKKIVLVNRWAYYTSSVSRPREVNPIARNPKDHTVNAKTSERDLTWAIENTVQRYRDIGVEVFLVADNPQQLYEPKDIVRKIRGGESKYLSLSVSRAEHIENQQAINAVLLQNTGGGVSYINFDSLLCNADKCPLVKDGKSLYSDDDHLSIEGALLVYPELAQALDEKPL